MNTRPIPPRLAAIIRSRLGLPALARGGPPQVDQSEPSEKQKTNHPVRFVTLARSSRLMSAPDIVRELRRLRYDPSNGRGSGRKEPLKRIAEQAGVHRATLYYLRRAGFGQVPGSLVASTYVQNPPVAAAAGWFPEAPYLINHSRHIEGAVLLVSQQDMGRMARIVDILHVLSKTYGNAFLRELKNSNHSNQMRPATAALLSRRFRSKSTPRYDISLLRNRASPINGNAIHAHADCSPLHRSTATEPSCARCKQCARPATRMTIGQHCKRSPGHDLLTWGCQFHFRFSFNNGLKPDIAPCRFCAITGNPAGVRRTMKYVTDRVNEV